MEHYHWAQSPIAFCNPSNPLTTIYLWIHSQIPSKGWVHLLMSSKLIFSLIYSTGGHSSMHSSTGWAYSMYISRLDIFLCLCIEGWHLPNICWNSTHTPLKTGTMYILELLQQYKSDSRVSISIHYSFITNAQSNHNLQHSTHSSFSVKHSIHRNRVHMSQSGKSARPVRVLLYSIRSKNLSLFTMKSIAYRSGL